MPPFNNRDILERFQNGLQVKTDSDTFTCRLADAAKTIRSVGNRGKQYHRGVGQAGMERCNIVRDGRFDYQGETACGN